MTPPGGPTDFLGPTLTRGPTLGHHCLPYAITVTAGWPGGSVATPRAWGWREPHLNQGWDWRIQERWCITFLTSLTVTNRHTLGGFQCQEAPSMGMWLQVWNQGIGSWWKAPGGPLCFLLMSRVARNPWYLLAWQHHSGLCLGYHMEPSLCVSVTLRGHVAFSRDARHWTWLHANAL